MKIYREQDATLDAVQELTIAVIGYGSQGQAQSAMIRDSGLNVIIGVREDGESFARAQEDGFTVYNIADAAQKGDIVQILLPDQIQAKIYNSEIAPAMTAGKTLCFSHGFNISYKLINPPEDIDVIMVAPKSPGPSERQTYLEGFGVPALVAVHHDASGMALQKALGMAKAMHFTMAGVIDLNSFEPPRADMSPFDLETFTDLFGEQSVLCGGVAELIQASFETMVEKGYPPEMAYFEASHELKLITDLIYKGGIEEMYRRVSNTAEYGGRTRGKLVVDRVIVKPIMQKMLEDCEDGTFEREWIAECDAGMPKLQEMREAEGNNLLQSTGDELRKLFVKPVRK
jgi:ketol-acid reductoisomerase